jgi:hypothetical protein
MAKKSMVPFSAAVAADVLSAFHLPGGNTLQVGLQLCRDKACRDSRCPPPINPRAARPLTKTPRDLQSAGRHTDDEGFGGYLSKRRSLMSRALQGEFQVTKYGLIATPYCGDEEIARVANSYGRRVSAEEVHNNPLTKVYLCQTIGYDWRLQSPCAGYLPHGGGHP